MDKQVVEKTITEYLKPIFGFALKRCKSIHDAQDLSQEIAIRAFRGLLIKDDVADVEKFIWTIAHNTLSNYYRDTAKSMMGVSIDEVAELLADPYSELDSEDNTESLHRLQSEIAYLSKMQRRIVIAYYFENRKQADIARELGIPLGTVKWHLFEAKNELKRGMNTMRKASNLKFNPIKFRAYGINGSIGTKSLDEFFRSTLAQNICYCVRNVAKTINVIADDLGVSPVYVETEAEFLAEYGFLQKQKDEYIANFVIHEPTIALLTMENDMYKRAAALFANDLYDALMNSGILEDERILCNHMLPGSTGKNPLRDKNFLLWTLIPYIVSCSGEKLMEERISFEEVATVRPDGAQNIFNATVIPDDMVFPEGYVYLKNWSGPMWNTDGDRILWQIDSEWSNREQSHLFYFSNETKRVLSMYKYEEENPLSKEDYAWLSERGYVQFEGDYNGDFTTIWKILVLQNDHIKKELLTIGEQIKMKYRADFETLKAPYVKAILDSVPAHLRKVKAYELQFIFHADAWFLLHCITALLENGKLKEPTDEQRKVLTTLITNV